MFCTVLIIIHRKRGDITRILLKANLTLTSIQTNTRRFKLAVPLFSSISLDGNVYTYLNNWTHPFPIRKNEKRRKTRYCQKDCFASFESIQSNLFWKYANKNLDWISLHQITCINTSHNYWLIDFGLIPFSTIVHITAVSWPTYVFIYFLHLYYKCTALNSISKQLATFPHGGRRLTIVTFRFVKRRKECWSGLASN